ncbi:MAG: YvrJ family protein [Phascolarctobacterium sp.]|nr:YvrJ family protein [Phascolarctobacterium sp.]MDY4920473.1 YvrJ family protein [Phascolarctobacterium sp.]
MDMDTLLTAAANYGFPMAISAYLLIRMESKIDQLSANIDALTRVIAAAK